MFSPEAGPSRYGPHTTLNPKSRLSETPFRGRWAEEDEEGDVVNPNP